MALNAFSVSPKALRLSCLALSAALWGGAAQAQVSISPLVIDVQANRGQAQGLINITNKSSEPFRARVYAEPFTYSRDVGFQTIPSNPSNLTPYLQFSPRELIVPPGVNRRVRLSARLSPSLPDGEYRAVIFTEDLKQANTTDSQGNSVGIKARIGVTVYVRKGNVSPNLAVNSASFNSQQKQIQLMVRNSGQASARPVVTWTLNQGGKAVRGGKVDGGTAIIAGSDRNLLLDDPGKNESALSAGEYQLTGKLAWGEDNNMSTLPFSVNLTVPANTSSSSRQERKY